MTNNILHRLPPPPLFTIRPPPIPAGSLFEHYQTVEILNGQCVRPSLNILNTSTTVLQKHEDNINWSNLFLFLLAIISVIFCIIIAIFIVICLKKLRKEEKQYKDYIMTGSLSSKNALHHHTDICTKTREHYKCVPNAFNCCDDYYSHQLFSMTEAPLPSVIPPHHIVNSTINADSPSTLKNIGGVDSSQNHQYECIPEHFSTMNSRHHHSSILCHHQHQSYHQSNTCSIPYATFSRSLRLTGGVTIASTSDSSQCTCSSPPSTKVVQEESSTPLLASSVYKKFNHKQEILKSSPRSTMIGWTKRNSSISTKRKSSTTHNNEQRHSFLSQLGKSAVLK